jgi:hypothetical protein
VNCSNLWLHHTAVYPDYLPGHESSIFGHKIGDKICYFICLPDPANGDDFFQACDIFGAFPGYEEFCVNRAWGYRVDGNFFGSVLI